MMYGMWNMGHSGLPWGQGHGWDAVTAVSSKQADITGEVLLFSLDLEPVVEANNVIQQPLRAYSRAKCIAFDDPLGLLPRTRHASEAQRIVNSLSSSRAACVTAQEAERFTHTLAAALNAEGMRSTVVHPQTVVQSDLPAESSRAANIALHAGSGSPYILAHAPAAAVSSTGLQAHPTASALPQQRPGEIRAAPPGTQAAVGSTQQGSGLMIVDPFFKQHFKLGGEMSWDYTRRLSDLPEVYIGTRNQLSQLVATMATELAKQFKARGVPVPMWRTATALMQHWGLHGEVPDMPPAMQGVSVLPSLAPATGACQGLAIPEASIRHSSTQQQAVVLAISPAHAAVQLPACNASMRLGISAGAAAPIAMAGKQQQDRADGRYHTSHGAVDAGAGSISATSLLSIATLPLALSPHSVLWLSAPAAIPVHLTAREGAINKGRVHVASTTAAVTGLNHQARALGAGVKDPKQPACIVYGFDLPAVKSQ